MAVACGRGVVRGGINKLNAQLVALAGVSAWTLRAWVGGEADARRGFATLAVWVVAGVFAPVAFELAWTGAGFTSWWHNVVALPFSSRAGDFEWVFRPEFYLRIRHDYYGALSIPWLGALGLATTLGIGGVLWHNARGLGERGWVVGAGAFVAAAGAGLLATNYEIAWVAMAAWLGLLAAWWVGFGRPARGRGFHVLIVAPAVVVGAAAWESAWRGQRSQFGYSTAPRSSYVDAGTVHADFAYLRGTFVPPEIAQTMNEAQQARARILPLYRNRTFYGPGLEWLQRVWPTTKVRGLPLWMHVGTSYGPDEEARLHDAIRPGGVYELVVASQPRDHWPETIDAELRRDYRRAHFGPVWVMYRARPPGAVPFEARTFLREFGGNVDPAWLASTLGARALSDGRKFLGTTRGTGVLVLRAASYRLHLEAVIRRTAAARKGTVRLRFESFGVSGEQLLERGSFDAELPAGEAERVFPTSIDPGGLPMMFAVSIPDDLEGCVEAGWRGPRLTHTVDGDDTPPALVPGAAPATRADDGYVAALLPSAGPRPAVFTRGAGPAGPEG
ncbi:hypothetical protein [Oleiharenicola sp. Vm1]|uniref:hypothetical protein n=1 Tax=Oleiharenicola sp. Vm1 TaxID=3398393 RepID=UPI0039F463A8